MKRYKALAHASIAAGVLLLLIHAVPASAIVYDFRGTCTGVCTGDVYAEFLIDNSYVPGTRLQCIEFLPCQVQRFRYIDNTGIEDWNLLADGGAGRIGDPSGVLDLPVLLGPALVVFGLTYPPSDFPIRTRLDGTWEIWTQYGYQNNVIAHGINGVFTLAAHEFIPEPSTSHLLFAALIGVVLARRRRLTAETTSDGAL